MSKAAAEHCTRIENTSNIQCFHIEHPSFLLHVDCSQLLSLASRAARPNLNAADLIQFIIVQIVIFHTIRLILNGELHIWS